MAYESEFNQCNMHDDCEPRFGCSNMAARQASPFFNDDACGLDFMDDVNGTFASYHEYEQPIELSDLPEVALAVGRSLGEAVSVGVRSVSGWLANHLASDWKQTRSASCSSFRDGDMAVDGDTSTGTASPRWLASSSSIDSDDSTAPSIRQGLTRSHFGRCMDDLDAYCADDMAGSEPQEWAQAL